jgi:hypothetical protein
MVPFLAYVKAFIPLFVKICYVQTEKFSTPNHFIEGTMSNKVKTSINNIDKQGYNFFLLFFEKNIALFVNQ